MRIERVFALPRLLAVLVIMAPVLAACGGTAPAASTAATAAAEAAETTAAPLAQTPSTAAPGRLPVVATFSVLADLVQNVGGDGIALTTLVPPGADTHTFEPSPRDSVALVDSTLVFENGLAFEPWLDDMFAASGSAARRVVASEGLDLIAVGEGELDPHVWQDAGNAVRMVERIRDALAEADSANAETYRANAERYLAELRELDAAIVAQVEALPRERRKLVTSHDTFGYYARRYGFDIVDTAMGSSTEEDEPSAAEIGQLVEEIKAAGVPAIFAENVANPRIMEQIAREAGVELGPPLFTDALAENGEGATYLDMMRYNTTTIVTALQP